MIPRPAHWLWILLLGAVALMTRPAAAVDLKIATVAPEGSSWMREMRNAAAQIREETGGAVELRLYGGGIQGTDAKVLRKIRIGQLQGATFVTSGLTGACADIAVYGLPLLFRTFEEVAFVRSKVDSRLIGCLREGGFEVLGMAGTGFARLMSAKPVARLSDAKGRRIWVPDGDTSSLLTMRKLGLSPVELPISDVMTGLQTGLLDAIAAPPAGAVILQWNTRVNYMTDLPLAYNAGYLVVDSRVFAALAPATQATVRAVLGAAYRRFDEQARDDDTQAWKALVATGLKPVTPEAAGLAEWQARIERTYGEMVTEGIIGEAILTEVRGHLAAYRAGRQSPGSGGAGARQPSASAPAARPAPARIPVAPAQ